MVEGYDPFSQDVLDEPSRAYGFLHETAPAHRFDGFDPPFYTLSRYADVERALRDIDTFSSEFGQGPRFTPSAGMLSDPPQHTFFRSLVQQAFTPKAIEALRGRIETLAHDLLALRPGTDAWDLHDDYAFPLPVTVISELLGVPADDLHLFKRWSDASVAAMGSEDPSAFDTELGAMGVYLRNEIRSRREQPGLDDLVARLVAVRDDGIGLDDDQILSVITQLLVGGNETTTSLITNACRRLLEDRTLYDRLVGDPSLVTPAIEESLRFDPPVLGLYRNTTRDVTIRGVVIPAGSKVMLHYAAANRDPEMFGDPNVFRLDRPARRHLAFGLGVHFCLGAQLARLEASVALTTLVEVCPDLRLLGPGERIAPFFLWGCRHLPVSG